MSAIAADDGANVAERVGQLTMPPTITMIRNTSEAAPMRTARASCRATGTRAATDPGVMTSRLYQQFNGNPVDPLVTRPYGQVQTPQTSRLLIAARQREALSAPAASRSAVWPSRADRCVIAVLASWLRRRL